MNYCYSSSGCWCFQRS